MSYVIENNGFARDDYGVRSTRLSLLSGNIDEYATELSIEADLLAWAQNAAQTWQDKLAENTFEQGEKFEAFQTSQEADVELENRYVSLKTVLVVRYGDDEEMLRLYGIDEPVPRKRSEVVNKAFDLVKTNEERLAEGDPKALPQAMTDVLKSLADDAYEKYKTAIIELSEAKDSTLTINELFDADSEKFRLIYTWISSIWDKKDPKLLLFGFVQTKVHSGGHVPAIPQNIAHDSGTGTFSWDIVAGTTSYQLDYRATASDDDWEEAYSGAENSVVFDPGNGEWEFRVRARNKHGFGKWSEVLEVETI